MSLPQRRVQPLAEPREDDRLWRGLGRRPDRRRGIRSTSPRRGRRGAGRAPPDCPSSRAAPGRVPVRARRTRRARGSGEGRTSTGLRPRRRGAATALRRAPQTGRSSRAVSGSGTRRVPSPRQVPVAGRRRGPGPSGSTFPEIGTRDPSAAGRSTKQQHAHGRAREQVPLRRTPGRRPRQPPPGPRRERSWRIASAGWPSASARASRASS